MVEALITFLVAIAILAYPCYQFVDAMREAHEDEDA